MNVGGITTLHSTPPAEEAPPDAQEYSVKAEGGVVTPVGGGDVGGLVGRGVGASDRARVGAGVGLPEVKQGTGKRGNR